MRETQWQELLSAPMALKPKSAAMSRR